MLISYTKVPNDERNKLILSYQSTFFVLPSKVPSKLPSKVPSKVRKKGTFEVDYFIILSVLYFEST